MSEFGRRVESEVAQLCGDLFLRDFVLASPKYRTPSGQLREAADALIPCGDTLVAVQVKTRTVKGAVLDGDSSELQRILKRIESAQEQVKTVHRALKSNSLDTATTLRGIEVPIGEQSFKSVVGVVVFDVLSEDGDSIADQVVLSHGYSRVCDIAVHTFSAPDFKVIATEQDTPPDLLNYLRVRSQLYDSHCMVPLVAELDLFGLFKTRYPYIEGRFEAMWSKRHERIATSDIVDRTIAEVYTCIGYDPTQEYPPEIRGSLPIGRAASGREYWHLIHKLGLLTRIERAQFGAKMLEKAKAADSKKLAFTVIHRLPEVGPIVYLCSNMPRHERTGFLQTLVKAACAYFDVPTATGVCTQSYSSGNRCHDFVVCEDISFPDPHAAREYAAKFFAPGKGTSLDEWGNDFAKDA